MEDCACLGRRDQTDFQRLFCRHLANRCVAALYSRAWNRQHFVPNPNLDTGKPSWSALFRP